MKKMTGMKLFVCLMALALAAVFAGCGAQGGSGLLHSHDFTAQYRIAPEGHHGICQCGEEGDVQAHTYEEGVCLCGAKQPSEGLQFEVSGNSCKLVNVGTCTEGEVVIPAYYEGLSVTVIGQNAFRDCESVTAVYIPETVTTIQQWAFYNCPNLVQIHFSEGLQTVENLAFIWCTSLTEVTFPDSLSKMGHSIFNECSSLEYVKLPASLSVLENGVFSNCDQLQTVVFPAGLTSVGDKAFWHCTQLSELRFEGTMAQWAAVSKGYENTWKPSGTNWCTDTGEFTVVCSDGTLTKTEAQLSA